MMLLLDCLKILGVTGRSIGGVLESVLIWKVPKPLVAALPWLLASFGAYLTHNPSRGFATIEQEKENGYS